MKQKAIRLVKTLGLYRNIYFKSKHIIKIHGNLRVGSNYLKKILESNFYGQVLSAEEYGWKHGELKYSKKVKYIILSKNPFSWIVSFLNWEKIHHRTEQENIFDFISSGLTHPKLKNEWGTNDVIEAWNKSYKFWLNFSDKKNVLVIRYEDLINDLPAIMRTIKTDLNLIQKTRVYENYKERADDWEKPSLQKRVNVNFYKNKEYMSLFNDKTISFIMSKLDREILLKLGYM